MGRQLVGHSDDGNSTQGVALQNGRVDAQEPASPPGAGGALLLHRGKPVLPQDGAYLARRLSREGVGGKQVRPDLITVGIDDEIPISPGRGLLLTL